MGVTQPLPILEAAGGASAREAWRSESSPRARYGGRLLLTGASGFVGRNLCRAFREHELVGAVGFAQVPRLADVKVATHRVQMDLRREGRALARLVAELGPDVVIHAAGNKNVRHCEAHPEEAEATNVFATETVAEACARRGCKLVYLSTDLVFDGERGGYHEGSVPRPTTVYGQTKLAGEEIALASGRDALVCRTGGVYGEDSPLLAWLASALASGTGVEAYQDVVSTPTLAADLALGLDLALGAGERGLLHLVGPQAVSRYEWFSAYASVFGHPRELVLPAVAGTRRRELLLPRDVSLDARRSEARLGHRPLGPRAGLERLLRGRGSR